MTGAYPPQEPDPSRYGPPFPAPPFPAPQPARPPRDRMVVILIAIIATLVVLCLAMAVGSVYFLREDSGDDDKTSKVLDHRLVTGG
ncbi:hypothetical protein ACFO1B_38495 [Dactylosporangium siamense]|uniref:Uncharacterized protein n=1 Tax=Dactylosporangium siamense TaxID=685454 RepID=A0A919PTY9_9ACTN|nr:hypothetical protein [Dactylosporangium siamense]GIG49667.1 hypothetical protein Dsi01nite_077080 [Dactylosporangium siamense]